MGVSIGSGGARGKKSVNADLNLVPYIDLLTCMVAFLLITAVWTQLARLEAQQKGQGQQGPDEMTVEQKKVVVLVNDLGFNLVTTDQQRELPKRGEDYDYEGLVTELRKVKEAWPDKNDAQVASEDQIKFDVLIRSMDAVLTSGFIDISLLDSGAAGIPAGIK